MDRPSLLCLYDMQVSSSSALQIRGLIFVLLNTTSGIVSWSRLSEQHLRVDKWSLCRG
jgi:hypothetical protein